MRWSFRLLVSLALLTGPATAGDQPGRPPAAAARRRRPDHRAPPANHTSGLYDPQVQVYQSLQDILDLRFEHWTPREVMALANDNGLLFEPGTAWSYSNTNYVVAGLLVERVTGASVARQLERRLIKPLGLEPPWGRRRHHPVQPVVLLGLGGAGVRRRRPGPVLRRPVRRPPAAPAAAGRDADPRSTPAPPALPAPPTGWAWRSTPCPAGRRWPATPGPLPGYNSGSFRLLGDDKDAHVVANLHPAPDALYAALSAALFEIFCGMAPAEAGAAARANPGTATVIRFR